MIFIEGGIFLCVAYVQCLCTDKYKHRILQAGPRSDSGILCVCVGLWRSSRGNHQLLCKFLYMIIILVTIQYSFTQVKGKHIYVLFNRYKEIQTNFTENVTRKETSIINSYKFYTRINHFVKLYRNNCKI